MARICLVAASLALTLLTLVAGTATAEAAAKRTADGHLIILDAKLDKLAKVPPLDSSPLSTEAFLTSDVTASISDVTAEDSITASVEIGYQVGYPVAAPDEVAVTLKTPDLTLNGGVSTGVNGSLGPKADATIGLTPSATIGIGANVGAEAGATAGATATVIPSQTFEFSVKSGGIKDVSIAKVDLTDPKFQLYFEGTHIAVVGAIGPVSVRPYARIVVQTKGGLYSLYSYGKTKTFGIF